MLSQKSSSVLEKLLKDGKIMGYEETKEGVVILAPESFSISELSELGINISKVIRLKGKIEALGR